MPLFRSEVPLPQPHIGGEGRMVPLLALAMVACTAVPAADWTPLRVRYELDEAMGRDVSRFSWGLDGDQWSLDLAGAFDGRRDCMTLSGPGGPRAVECVGFVPDIANPLLTMAGNDWDQSYPTGMRTTTPHHLLEMWQDERWRLFRLIWPVGGLSGPPPVPLVMVAQDRRTGRWAALATSFDHHVPDGGDTHGLEVLGDGSLVAWCWQWHTRSVLARRSWSITAHGEGVRWRPGAADFMLNTYNGIPSTYARDPRDAVHWGYQEVAWHLASVTDDGGEVVAYADSPRRIECEDDLFDGLIVPRSGAQVRFEWPAQVFLVPYRAHGRWASRAEAWELARRGGWDVVLFHADGAPTVAQRLVQHSRAFPHSSPPPL